MEKKIIEEQIKPKINAIIERMYGFEIQDHEWKDTFYDVGLDSLDYIELTIECEKEWNISLSDDQIMKCSTPIEFAYLIKDLIKK